MNLVESFSLTEPGYKHLVKSPMNYIGGKFRTLKQILPLISGNINTFVDLFCGGCNVAVNVPSRKTICNDINFRVMEIFQILKDTPIVLVKDYIESRIKEYKLSKTNEEGFLKFREDYNKFPNPLDLYVLGCYSYNYQFRFNHRLEYNSSFGKNRSAFTKDMERNLIEFSERIRSKNIEFSSLDFMEMDLSFLGENDFLYADPPYIITTGNYNDGNRGFKDWGKVQEEYLLNLLDNLNSRGVRFAFSNVLEHKGKTNEPLLKWSERYHVHDIRMFYGNCSYNTKEKGGSREVLITNYEVAE